MRLIKNHSKPTNRVKSPIFLWILDGRRKWGKVKKKRKDAEIHFLLRCAILKNLHDIQVGVVWIPQQNIQRLTLHM